MRRPHILKGNATQRVPTRMIWVDTEALNEQGQPKAGKQKLFFGVAIYENYATPVSRNPVNHERLRFTTPGEFWDWTTARTVPGRALWVFAHNWNYDAGILNTSRELPARGWECTKYINGKPPLIVRWRKDGATLFMVDTLNYFTTSLESLGVAVGLPKLAMPETMGEKEWSAYAFRDVEILQKAFLHLRAFVQENDLGVMQPTLASQALTAYRHRFMKTPILIHDHIQALELEREAYHGGRTESFYRGKVADTLYKLDINSMYPHIMGSQPVAHWFEAYFPAYSDSWWREAFANSVVARVRIRTDEPCYGVVRGGKLIFPVGSFQTTLSTPEIHYALAKGHIEEIGAFAYYRQAVLFKDYVDWCYAQRQTYKEQGNYAFEYLCKIMMNSLYGKFGQNGRKWTQTKHEWGETLQGICGDCGGHFRTRLGQTETLLQEGESENSFPMIAAEITAHGRMQLWQLILQAGESNVYYCDTDSLIVNSQGMERLQSEIDSRLLGKLKLEGTSYHSEFNAPKHYLFGSDFKAKGVRKSATQNIQSRGYEQEQFRSWDYYLSKGQDGYIEVVPVVKFLSAENTKRVVTGDGWTTPIELRE